jgi:hypothetical protein
LQIFSQVEIINYKYYTSLIRTMKKYTKEQLIFFLKSFSKELSRTPTCKDINKSGKYPSSKTYINRFSSWNSALVKAGLTINSRKEYTEEELADTLRQLYKELGRAPMSTDLPGREWCASYSTYQKHFGSWEKALGNAGISRTKTSNLKDFIISAKKKSLKTELPRNNTGINQ